MAVTEDQLHAYLVGDTGLVVSRDLVLSLRSLTAWPADAYFFDFESVGTQVVGWINGNSIGVVTAQDVSAGVAITANVYPVHRIEALRVGVVVVPNNGPSRFDVLRSLEIQFPGNESVSVDVSLLTTRHARTRADYFVTQILRKVEQAGGSTSDG